VVGEKAGGDGASVIEDGFVDVPYAATFLKLSRGKVYGLMDAGQLRYAKFGRSRRIPRKALMEFAQKAVVG
jgi:excisionase family DNA binding protein